jgi:hypothetical protein
LQRGLPIRSEAPFSTTTTAPGADRRISHEPPQAGSSTTARINVCRVARFAPCRSAARFAPAEALEDIKFRGRVTSQRWVKTRDNHFHDTRIGNVALAEYLGLSSTTPEQWAALARARGLPAELTAVDLFTPRASARSIDAKDAEAAIAARKTQERAVASESPTPSDWLAGYDVRL